jgi:hypothetical protein
MNKRFKFLLVLKIVFGITAFVLLFGFGTMHLWNWLVPSLFHGPVITFVQAIGLLILSKILFGGFGGRKFGRGGHCGPHRGWGGHHHWKHHRDRFNNMTPEEKEKLKQRFKERCRNWYWDEDDNKTGTPEPQS